MTRTYTCKNRGQRSVELIPKLEWKQSDGQTRPIAVPGPPTRSVIYNHLTGSFSAAVGIINDPPCFSINSDIFVVFCFRNNMLSAVRAAFRDYSFPVLTLL